MRKGAHLQPELERQVVVKPKLTSEPSVLDEVGCSSRSKLCICIECGYDGFAVDIQHNTRVVSSIVSISSLAF